MKQLLFTVVLAGVTFAFGNQNQTQVRPKRALDLLAPAHVRTIAFSPDGRILASGGVDNDVSLWEVASGKVRSVFKGHTAVINSVVFSPDGKVMASGSGDQTIRLWEVSTGREIAVLKGHNGQITSVAFSSDGRMLASGSWDRTARTWDLEKHQEMGSLYQHNSAVFCVAFSKNDKTLATGDLDGVARLWNIGSDVEKLTLSNHTWQVQRVVFSSDGDLLATAGGTVKLYDVVTGKELATLAEDPTLTGPGGVYSLAFSPDGEMLIFADRRGNRVEAWELKSRKLIPSPNLNVNSTYVNCVTFDNSGKLVAVAGGHFISVWKSSSVFPLQSK